MNDFDYMKPAWFDVHNSIRLFLSFLKHADDIETIQSFGMVGNPSLVLFIIVIENLLHYNLFCRSVGVADDDGLA